MRGLALAALRARRVVFGDRDFANKRRRAVLYDAAAKSAVAPELQSVLEYSVTPYCTGGERTARDIK